MTDRISGKWLTVAAAGTAVIGAYAILRFMRKPTSVGSFYVALGSSYAAGFGLGRRAPGSPFISRRSNHGYPQQLARLLRVPSFTDMTSSGSTVLQVLHGGQMWLGPQLDALGPETRLVTMTAGGNDIGYVGDLLSMALGDRPGLIGSVVRLIRKPPRPVNGRNFDALTESFTATMLEIVRRSPRARVVVATYPSVLPASGTCPTLGITDQQSSLMRSVVDRLAEVTRDAASVVGATLVDMTASSAGHDACSADPWLNGFRPRVGADFHPNLAGARATAQAIAAELERPHFTRDV